MYGWDLITLFFFLEIIMYLPFTVEQLEVKPPKAPHHPRPPTKKKSWLLFWKWFHTSSYFWFLTARENEAQFSLNQQKLEIMYHTMSVFIYLFIVCSCQVNLKIATRCFLIQCNIIHEKKKIHLHDFKEKTIWHFGHFSFRWYWIIDMPRKI